MSKYSIKFAFTSAILISFGVIHSQLLSNESKNEGLVQTVRSHLLNENIADIESLRVRVDGKTIVLNGLTNNLENNEAIGKMTLEIFPNYAVENRIQVK